MRRTANPLPEALYSAAQVAAFDQRLIGDFGVPGFSLMQRAAAAAWRELTRRWPEADRICVFCGPGNNGGDGYLIARLALEAGYRVQLYGLAARESMQGDAASALSAFETAGGTISTFDNTPVEADVVVDSLLGTGLSRDVEGRFADAIGRINEAKSRGAGVLAVDIASGIDATTGRLWKTAVRADVTATFIGLKAGLLTGAGAGYCSDVVFDDLGAPRNLYDDTEPLVRRMTDALRQRALPPRAADAHKGAHGHVLCMGGNRGMGGAIRMTGEAALRSGAGLVSVTCHPDHAGAMSQARPEMMCRGVPPGDSVQPLVEKADVIAVGPGLGADDWADELFTQAVAAGRPLVVDADGLAQLTARQHKPANCVITPHPGEAARLLGTDTASVNNDRAGCVRELANQYNAVAVLKGAGTLVATDDDLWLCTAGNPGMATGGMGDVLTGITAGLIAQGLPLADAAVLGVWLHACSADTVAAEHGERGLLATDLLPELMHKVNP